MHILPGALILALLFALPAHSAMDPRMKSLAGVWTGSVTTSPDGCVWEVKSNTLEKQAYLTGNFIFSGPCSKGGNRGTFNATPSGKDCFSVNANVPGLPKMQFPACFDEKGALVFNSMLFSGSLKFREEGRKADLAAKAVLGSASGSFRKQFNDPAAKAGKKGKKNAQPLARPLEIYGGSDQRGPKRP